MELMETVARRLQVQRAQVQAVMTLLEEGSTVPFIARYRKERTKGLDEEAIRQIQEMVHAQQKLEQRKAKASFWTAFSKAATFPALTSADPASSAASSCTAA